MTESSESKNRIGSSEIQDFINNLKRSSASRSVREVIDDFYPFEYPFVSLVVTVIFLIPVPMMGLSSVAGLILCILSVNYLAPRRLIPIPNFIGKRELSQAQLISIAGFCERIMSVLAFLPRIPLENSRKSLMAPFFIIVMAVSLALPLPIPFTNAIPALSIILFSLYIIDRNLILFILAGLVVLFNIAFLYGLYFGGSRAVSWLTETGFFRFLTE